MIDDQDGVGYLFHELPLAHVSRGLVDMCENQEETSRTKIEKKSTESRSAKDEVQFLKWPLETGF